jgi:hypothetical protein
MLKDFWYKKHELDFLTVNHHMKLSNFTRKNINLV